MENNNSAKKVQCTIKLVQDLFKPPLSKSTASSKIQLLREVLKKPTPKIITMDEFEEYYFKPNIK